MDQDGLALPHQTHRTPGRPQIEVELLDHAHSRTGEDEVSVDVQPVSKPGHSLARPHFPVDYCALSDSTSALTVH